MRKIVFDIETTSEAGRDPTLLDIAVVCIHDSETDEYSSYYVEELTKLWPIIEHSDMLIGWNSDGFDIPILNKYYPGDLSQIKSLDLMQEVREAMGRRLKLDNVAKATLGTQKSGNGLEALTWWRNGEVEKVRDYCIDDVRITKEIYDYAIENSHLKYKELSDTKEVKLDTSSWEEKQDKTITHTLPF